MPNADHIILGKTNWRSQERLFGISSDDRTRHILCLGKTGVGKSTWLRNCAVQDLRAGRGFLYIDPHGIDSEILLDYVPQRRFHEVVYFCPKSYPVGLNILEDVDPEMRHLVTSHVVTLFKTMWQEFWGPQSEQLLSYTIATLADAGGHTLLDAPRLLTDINYRKEVIAETNDEELIRFWEEEYAPRKADMRREAIAPILNKLSQFVLAPPIRDILGVVKSKIDLEWMRTNSRVLIANLSGIGDQESKLLANLLITKSFLLAKHSEERVDFPIYLDEAGRLAGHILESVLSESRKFGIMLTLAMQYTQQVSPEILAALLGNVGTLACFRLGAQDSAILAPEFAPKISAMDLQELGKYEMYLKLAVNGMTSRPFSATSLAPLPFEDDEARKETVKKISRERYMATRQV